MKPRRIPVAGAVVGLTGILLAGACGSPAGDGPPQAGVSVWRSDSARLDIKCSGFWEGSMRFLADRAQLTSAELDLLGDLRTVTPGTNCLSDTLGCALEVTDAAGHVTKYLAVQDDTNCMGSSEPLVRFATLDPFLQTLSCQYARGWSMPSAPMLPREARCWNGVFAAAAAARTLHVDDGQTTGHVELLDCASPNRVGKLSFTIVDASTGANVVAGTQAAATTADQPCVQATPTFPHAGDYTLNISVASGFRPGGDFWARYY